MPRILLITYYLYLPGRPYWKNKKAVYIYRIDENFTISEPFVYFPPENSMFADFFSDDSKEKEYAHTEFERKVIKKHFLKILGAYGRVLAEKGDDRDVERTREIIKNFNVEKSNVILSGLSNRRYLQTGHLWDMPAAVLPSFD